MGDYYLLNGTKNWITNGSTSKIHIVIAQTEPGKGTAGISAFLVESTWDGVKIGAKEDKLGIRSSDTTSINYTDVKVPKENRLGTMFLEWTGTKMSSTQMIWTAKGERKHSKPQYQALINRYLAEDK